MIFGSKCSIWRFLETLVLSDKLTAMEVLEEDQMVMRLTSLEEEEVEATEASLEHPHLGHVAPASKDHRVILGGLEGMVWKDDQESKEKMGSLEKTAECCPHLIHTQTSARKYAFSNILYI